jgi:aryl-alcohol dehydrogenase-like predicted oxidoreductase
MAKGDCILTLRHLGNSDLNITRIGIGAWAIGGGKWEFGWGPQNDKDSIEAIHAGLEQGLNWIDTAALYGLGHSESVVGRAIKDLHERPYVFSKCSLVWDQDGRISHNLQAPSIRREAEASLKRLGLERIDLYQIHWPAWKGQPEGASPGSIEEAMTALMALQREGKIRRVGVSNFNAEQMARARAIGPIVSLQPPYSLVVRDAESSNLPFALRNGIGVVVYSPMYSGLLSGAMTRSRIDNFPKDDWRRSNPNFQEPLLTQNLELVEILGRIGRRHNTGPGQIAIAWTLANPTVTGAIVGVRTAKQAREIAAAAELRLSAEEVAEIAKWRAQKAA